MPTPVASAKYNDGKSRSKSVTVANSDRTARKIAALAASLKDKLEAQKKMKAMEATRNKKRRELFDAQDRIDEQRDGLIGKIEQQMKQRHRSDLLFAMRWHIR